MKLFLGPLAPDQTYITVGYRRNLDDFCQASEATEICAPTMLDFVASEDRESFIKHLVSKMRHGCSLKIGGTDLISLSLAIFNKTLKNDDANKLIFGEKTEPVKVGVFSLEETRKLLLANGLRITKQVPGLAFLVVAERP